MIELNQLGSIGFDPNENLFIHKDPISFGKDQNVAKTIKELTEKLSS